MNPEERLDAAVERLVRRQPAILMTPEEDALLTEAHLMIQIQAMPVPADFSTRLEERLRQRTQDLGEAATMTTRAVSPTRSRWVRAMVSVSIVGLLLLGGWGLLVASAQSVPGDPLYGIKQWQQQIALARTTQPLQRVQLQVQELNGAITDLATEVAQKRPTADIAVAFTIMVTDTQQVQQAVGHLSPSDQATVLPALSQAEAREVRTLYAILPPLPATERAEVTTQLGVLGEPVPQITHVTIAHEPGELVQLTISGEHFAPGTLVVLDEMALVPTSVTGTQVTVEVATHLWGVGKHQVGVQNPNDTTALTTADDAAKGTTETPTPEPSDSNGHHHATPTPRPPRH